MDYQLSTTSCFTSGIPLLPPLVTSDITTEIQYYKKLAVAVEERLKALEILRRATLNKSNSELDKDNLQVPRISNGSTDLTNKLLGVDTTLSDTVPTKDDTTCLIDFGSDAAEKDKSQVNDDQVCDDNGSIKSKQKQLEQIDKSISEDDKTETFKGDSICSDTITASTDLNQYLNTSISSKTDTAETTPENWKPQVPKTLNIVPITVDPSKLPDKSCSVDGETPKLIRTGSYVLDRPSPVLLATIQNDLPGGGDYTPTRPTAQAIKRKEWSISQIKADLKAPTNVKESKSRLNLASKSRKTSYSNIPCQRVCKSVSNSKTGSPMDIYQTKSVDCIQTIFAKEYNKSCKTPTNRSSNLKYSSPYNSTNNNRNNGFKKPNKQSSILNLADKLSESLGNLNNSPKPVKRPEKKKDSNLNKSSDQESVKSNENLISNKPKPVITSEKIVTVFKEIQDTHKKQMLELMTRQQKEQMQMQENFKKQQILLLAQIRKAFPEISISALTEAISHKSVEHTTPLSSKTVNCKLDSIEKEKSIDKPHMNGINCYKQDQEIISANFQYPSKELKSSASCHSMIQSTNVTASHYQDDYQTNQNYDENSPLLKSCSNFTNVKSIDDIPVGTSNKRRSSVSRQLFPLENKTIHYPVLDDILYTEKHIKAATVINAYVKGFLTRRLMKTEKIIALKNTYREALHCMLRLHVDAPLNLPELNFHRRLQLQCDAASMNIVDLFSQSPAKRMEIIAHDREIKRSRSDRPSSARSYSFATQRTLARKKMKEMGVYPSMQNSVMSKSCPARTRCQTWTSNTREKKITTSLINHGIKRSTSAGAVRRPWR